MVKVLSVNEKNLCFKDISSSYWSHLGIKESEKTNKLIMREYQKNIVHQAFATWNWKLSGSFTLDPGMGKTFILYALAKAIVNGPKDEHQVVIIHGSPYVCKHHYDVYASKDP